MLVTLGLAAEARGEVEELMSQGLLDIPRDVAFLPAMVQLSEAVALLGDVRWMQTLYDLLLPYAALCAVFGNGVSFLGSVSHYLGLLAARLGRETDAARHLERAIAVHAGMGAQPWLALSRCEYGALLLQRAATSEIERGSELVAQTLATAEALGMHGLVARARSLREPLPAERPAQAAGDSNAATRPGVPPEVPMFRAEGDYWTIVYGGRGIRLRDSRGLRYLAQLLWHPGREFHSSELVRLATAEVPGPTRLLERFDRTTADLGDAGEAIDDQARREYRRHLEDLREQLAEADARNDFDRAGRLRAEIDVVAHALGSTPRGRALGAHAERTRLMVTKGIKAALTKIRTSHPALARHIAATVRRGYVCVYMPDPRHPITWER